MINMQRTLLDKVMQEQMGSVSRGKKESRRNTRDQKQCYRNKECL